MRKRLSAVVTEAELVRVRRPSHRDSAIEARPSTPLSERARHVITMADSAEKTAPTENVQTPPHSVEHEDVQLPRGWMYQKFKIGRFAIPWYASPETQLLLVAFVCFLCPGMPILICVGRDGMANV